MKGARIDLRFDGPVARITICNADRHNAMTLAMWTELSSAVEAAGRREEVRVATLSGQGGEAFASGADVSEFERQRSTPAGVQAYDAAVQRAHAALQECALPVVARIQGVCMGGGLGLALSCDLRYAASTARFRMPAARMGLGYGQQAMRRMVDVVGAATAADLFFTARAFDGREAERIGLVHRAYEAAELEAAVEQTLATVAENAPLTLAAAKLAIRESWPASGASGRVREAVRRCFESHDYEEGRRAFAEKRPPRFTGR